MLPTTYGFDRQSPRITNLPSPTSIEKKKKKVSVTTVLLFLIDKIRKCLPLHGCRPESGWLDNIPIIFLSGLNLYMTVGGNVSTPCKMNLFFQNIRTSLAVLPRGHLSHGTNRLLRRARPVGLRTRCPFAPQTPERRLNSRVGTVEGRVFSERTCTHTCTDRAQT